LTDEFIDQVIKEVKNLWPECKMVRGSPRHSESNGGVERVNRTVQQKLGGWMKTNKSNNWAMGCRIAMWRINTQIHQTIKDTPYHLTYGQHPRVGISNLPVAADILKRLSTETELQDLVYSKMNVAGVAIPAQPPTTDNDPLPKESVEMDDAIEDTDDELVEMATGIADSILPLRLLISARRGKPNNPAFQRDRSALNNCRRRHVQFLQRTVSKSKMNRSLLLTRAKLGITPTAG